MAILNFIKSGSYSRLSRIDYHEGQIARAELTVYTAEPTLSFREADTYVETSSSDEKGDYTSEDYPVEESVTVLNHMNFDAHEDFFGDWIDPSKNLHAQVYDLLLAKPMFDGCVSDED